MSCRCFRHCRSTMKPLKTCKMPNFPFVQHGLPIARTDPLTIPLVIHTWCICHKTPRTVQDGKLLLNYSSQQALCRSETPDYDKYRPYFGWVNTNTIRDTFKHTTQLGVSFDTLPMKRHLKSRNPALNVPHRNWAVATDTVYSNTSAVDSGVKQAQLFVGKESLISTH